MDRRNIAKDLREYSLTLTGLVGLQLPCLVSAAQPSSPLAQFQSYGLLFNMSSATLKDHFSFSPENLAQGRYHTLVTNLFNHQGKLWYSPLELCAFVFNLIVKRVLKPNVLMQQP